MLDKIPHSSVKKQKINMRSLGLGNWKATGERQEENQTQFWITISEPHTWICVCVSSISVTEPVFVAKYEAVTTAEWAVCKILL